MGHQGRHILLGHGLLTAVRRHMHAAGSCGTTLRQASFSRYRSRTLGFVDVDRRCCYRDGKFEPREDAQVHPDDEAPVTPKAPAVVVRSDSPIGCCRHCNLESATLEASASAV